MNILKEIPNQKLLQMEEWCQNNLQESILYFSVDIRNANFKIAPVDANFFPAGFGLLSHENQKNAAKEVQKKLCGKKILLLIEDHTRNQFYFKNVEVIQSILQNAHNEVRIANLSNHQISTISDLKLERILKKQDKVITHSGFVPDVVVINNDMISKKPEVLCNIQQECTPPVGLGWFNRKKSDYFDHYESIITNFCNHFNVDKWLFSTSYEKCNQIDFQQRKGLECIAFAAERVMIKIQKKYDEYGIQDKPYVFIKADKGSYGIGVTHILDPQDILDANKTMRNKMRVTKGNVFIEDIIIQEGVKTADLHQNHPAELLAYSVYGQTVALMNRYNTMHTNQESLNSKGMDFVDKTADLKGNSILQIISKLSVIAAEKELENIIKF